MADFIILSGEICALIEDLDLQFEGVSYTDLDDTRYFELS